MNRFEVAKLGRNRPKIEKIARIAFHPTTDENEALSAFRLLKTLLARADVDIADAFIEGAAEPDGLLDGALSRENASLKFEVRDLRIKVATLQTDNARLKQSNGARERERLRKECDELRATREELQAAVRERDERIERLACALDDALQASPLVRGADRVEAVEPARSADMPVIERWWRSLDRADPALAAQQVRGWISTTDLYVHVYQPWERGEKAGRMALETFGAYLKADAAAHADCPFSSKRKAKGNGFDIIFD